MKKYLTLGLFLIGWVFAISIIGCDEQKFESQHPIEAEIIRGAEEVAEPIVDTALHLPLGTTKIVVDGVESELNTPPNTTS